GTMNFGKRTPALEAERIVKRALERGVRVFDTANAYVEGESERIVGRALRGTGDDVCIATKVGFGRIAGKPEGLAPERIGAALDESLARLGVDHVALYYLHVPDHDTPIERTLEAIGQALRSGKIGRFGISNYASWQILEVLVRCEAMGLAKPAVAQQLYNLLLRQLDLEYFRFARRYRVHTTVYNPLAGGLLTGRYRPGDAIARGSRFDRNRLYQGRYWSEAMLGLAAEYEAIAREFGLGLTELAYAWLAGHPAVDSVLVGPASVEQLDQALDAVTLTLPDEARERIDALHLRHLGTETSYAR
ncbi:MAG: aldo/keto reductase, partial [Deltaproteobacteria bacterium]|nr:aldo/keto reductase [Deltaproteobacteria bacterium]